MVAIDFPAYGNCSEIRACSRLGKSLTPNRFAGKNLRQMKGLLRVGAAGDQRGSGVLQANRACIERGSPGAHLLFMPDEQLYRRKTETAVFLWPADASPLGMIQSA